MVKSVCDYYRDKLREVLKVPKVLLTFLRVFTLICLEAALLLNVYPFRYMELNYSKTKMRNIKKDAVAYHVKQLLANEQMFVNVVKKLLKNVGELEKQDCSRCSLTIMLRFLTALSSTCQ